MTPYALLLSLFLLFASCSQQLTFKAERYDLDQITSGSTGTQARAVYERLHPPVMTLEIQKIYLQELSRAYSDYSRSLQAMNYLVQALGDPEQAARRGVEKATAIDNLIKPIIAEIDAEIKRIDRYIDKYGALHPAVPVERALLDRMDNLPGQFIGQKIETEKSTVQTVVAQLKKLGVEKLKKTLDTAAEEMKRIPDTDSQLVQITAMRNSLNAVSSSDLQDQIAANVGAAKTRTKELKTDIEGLGGDLVMRTHQVYQDMSDPFLVYVAGHPENWKILDNYAQVKGEGDTEFILVLEQQLDGRWKSVAVDPEKIVRARLRISRRVAGAVTALGGIALKAYGVPLPPSLSASVKFGGDSVDYSRMTGEEEVTRERNALLRSKLRELKAFAIDGLGKIDAKNYTEMHAQLMRRLSEIPDK
jgi:hypothetical protein